MTEDEKARRRQKAESLLASVAQETQDAIRSSFGVGRHGESMRSLAREYGLPKNVVRLILGMKIR